MKKKAIIISIKGTKLSLKEINLISSEKPWGIILFKRNLQSINQIKSLTKKIRRITKDKNYPILIDEEGGKVSRLSKLINNNFTQNYFGKIFEKNELIGSNLYIQYIASITQVLKGLGININTVPVLDILKSKTHNVIGKRSFSNKVATIIKLGNICVKTYRKHKISTVIKHIPGHGEATLDSHFNLPRINKDYNYLIKNDFKCFKDNSSHFAMTGHVLYEKLDKKNCVTHSKKIIREIIRKKIGYSGILISDDISMKSLKYSLAENALKSLDSGCNLVLYCAGRYIDNKNLLRIVPYIDDFTKKKTSEFYKFLG